MTRISCAILLALAALFVLGCTSTERSPETAEHADAAPDPELERLRGRLDAARATRESGDFAGARATIVSTIDGALVELGDRVDEAALALLEEMARFAMSSGAGPSAERARARVLDARSRTLPDDHPDLLTARERLGIARYDLGDLEGARPLFEQVLEARSRTLPPDDRSLARARANVAAVIKAFGEIPRARELEEEVLDVLERTLPEDHRDIVTARANLATTIKSLGDLGRARAIEEQVLEVRTRTLPETHPDRLWAQFALASTLFRLGDLRGAKALIEPVVEIRSRILPDDHIDLAVSRGNLAAVLKGLGELDAARALEEKVVDVLSRALSEDHPDLQRARLNLADSIFQFGDLPRARRIQEQALEALEHTFPDDHPDLQTARQNLAGTLRALGDLQGARPLFEKVLEIRSRTLPEDHPELQIARMNFAVVLFWLGEVERGREIEESAIEVLARTLPEDHPDLLYAQGTHADTLRALGELERARELGELVLQVRERTLPPDHPDLQISRFNLAHTSRELGNLVRARDLEELVHEVRSRTLPEGHDDLQAARQNLAVTIAVQDSRSGEREAARRRCVELVLALCRARTQVVREIFLSSPSREAEERCVRAGGELDAAISFARGLSLLGPSRELEPACFVLSEVARGAAIASAGLARRAADAPRYVPLREELVRASEDLAGLARRGATGASFDAARAKRERTERELVDLAREVLGDDLGGIDLEIPALARNLGERAASASFRRYRDGRFELDPVPREILEDRLCAFVVRGAAPDGDPADALTMVDLGPMDVIERVVRAWRETVGVAPGRGLTVAPGASGEDPRARGDELRRLVLDPLLPAIGERERILLVLDDVLNLVAFDALPLGADGSTLVGDRWRIETRATLGELSSEETPRAGVPSLLAIGGVRYDGEESDPEPVARILRGGAWSGGFADLPATRDEAAGIVSAFSEEFGDARATLLARGDAERSRLLELAPRARFLHVATHGWFAPESIASWTDPNPLDARSGLGVRLSGQQQVKGTSPMLLCGLALAGANLPEDALGRAPGLVTADELSALDLSGCELAVLSACDTNVGEHRAGQGVASLQRALQMAGARSVITSLWKVPDEATKDLMLDFYRRIWVEKEPKGQALWEAKRKLREAGHPTRDWAAWVLTGDPG